MYYKHNYQPQIIKVPNPDGCKDGECTYIVCEIVLDELEPWKVRYNKPLWILPADLLTNYYQLSKIKAALLLGDKYDE